MEFALLKTIHIGTVAVSCVLFFVRGIWMLSDSPLLYQRWAVIYCPERPFTRSGRCHACRPLNVAGIRHEGPRIAFLIQRDGLAAAIEWVRRTMRIYRRAVLNKQGFPDSDGYPRKFIESYCDFKRWLAAVT